MLTKKHFQVFAQICRSLRLNSNSGYDAGGYTLVRMADVEKALIEAFKAENGRFDQERFIQAIGAEK